MWHNVRAAALNAMLQLLVIYRLVDHCGIFLGCRYMTEKLLLKLDTIKFIISTNHSSKSYHKNEVAVGALGTKRKSTMKTR